MKTDKRRLTIFAIVIIIIIIVSGVVSLVLQEKVTRFEAISAIGTSEDSLWIIEGNRLMRYSGKGAFLGEFVFNASFSDIFTNKKKLYLYSYPQNAVHVYDSLLRFLYAFPTENAQAVYYDNGFFSSIISGKRIIILSNEGKKLQTYTTEYEPSGVIFFNNELWYAPYGKNKLISVATKRELVIKDLPQGFSIIRGYASATTLYFIAAQRRSGDYYYARLFTYSLPTAVLRQSTKRYIYPITIAMGHNRVYIGSNLENAIDIYSLEGEYKGRFGDDSFIKKHTGMYLNRTRYVVIVMIMNAVVVVSFFLSLYVFILSNRLKKKEAAHAHD